MWRVILTVLFTVSVGCNERSGSPTAPSEPLTVTRLGRSDSSLTYSSNLLTAQRTIVRDEAAWRTTWSSIWRTTPVPDLPPVDFTREMVVVAALGQRPTGGFSIYIDSATAQESGVQIRIRTVSPGPRCGTTQAITEPVDVARVTRRDGSVTFEEVAETTNCP